MNGQDLINYIKKHHLEEAEIDTDISDPLQFVVTVPKTPALNERELVYDFTRDFVYDRYLCVNQISYEEASKMRDLDLKADAGESCPNSCYQCDYYSDSHFWADNSIVATAGSCTKCERNFVNTDPYNQVPSWCPLKGE